jgi:hypothetical protein
VNAITNTERDERHPEWLRGLNPDAIIDQEWRGQAQVIESSAIPTNLLGGITDDVLTDVGFELGEPFKDDPMFRPAKLPEGWSIVATDHPMWTEIVDADGLAWFQLFYKAAFYDRKAHLLAMWPDSAPPSGQPA